MPLQATSGAASYDAFGGGVPVVPNYIEEVFSTYLYTGTGATQTITNNIDMTKGYLLWFKDRSAPRDNKVYDSARGVDQTLVTNTAAGQVTQTFPISVSTTGFTIPDEYDINTLNNNIVSWTFRKQPKFCDVLTYTGDGAGTRTFNHDLGSVPAFVIIKRATGSGSWFCYHTSLGLSQYIILNSTAAAATFTDIWQTPTSTTFGFNTTSFNASGNTYVAYLFAHNAGGFGLTGTDNVISCGTFTTDSVTGRGTVNLGYEPQWVLLKRTSSTADWYIADTMRGWNTAEYATTLNPNLTATEYTSQQASSINATGFTANGPSSATYIYIAIRRGPMKVPTSGTSVFSPVARAGTSATATVTTGFPVDMTIIQDRTQTSFAAAFDRLRGATRRLFIPFTSTEASEATTLTSFAVQDGFTLGTDVGAGFVNTTGDNYINWSFSRAPSFFDEVCYTGNSTGSTAITHNLGVVPELIIVKSRSAARNWPVYIGSQGNNGNSYFNRTDAWAGGSDTFAYTTPTASEFYVGNNALTNNSGETYVSYLFATCAGVSKVGSYTGNGTTQTINCGFGAGGARFVLIKRTDAAGDWYVYDTARGMTVLTDPYLALNSTSAETATLGSVTTVSTGFALNSTILAAINVSSGTYIFLAIA